MGNAFACMPRKEHRGAAAVSRSKRMGSTRPPRGGAAKLTPAEEELLHRQALAMAIHQHLDAGGSMSRRIDAGGGSMSRRIGPGSTSSRRHGNLPDSVTNAKAVQIVLENLETKKVVLVHGEGFGAWCWYKTISLLEEAGLDPVALDLTGSGIDHTDTNSITTLEEYSKPLIDYLSKLPENEKASTTSVSLHTFIKNQNRVSDCCVHVDTNAGCFGRS
uniref:AB hydrolase-1 domain-containing protein n=1 Tax=Aegilops tauschii subsp. strangulata TaxID=200361 RepID=A0A453S252_AEGTS